MSSGKLMLLVLLLAAPAFKADAQEHNAHHEPAAAILPIEPGQGAFAAIAEIVARLDADPATDWSRVNVTALREHLLNMELVTLRSSVVAERTDNTLRFEVTGEGRTLAAIRAMVPAHASELSRSTEWSVVADVTDTGAALSLSSNSEHELTKIAALGFYGVMATGAHHQQHHLAIAKGAGPH